LAEGNPPLMPFQPFPDACPFPVRYGYFLRYPGGPVIANQLFGAGRRRLKCRLKPGPRSLQPTP
jgi:hypothetical protein